VGERKDRKTERRKDGERIVYEDGTILPGPQSEDGAHYDSCLYKFCGWFLTCTNLEKVTYLIDVSLNQIIDYNDMCLKVGRK